MLLRPGRQRFYTLRRVKVNRAARGSADENSREGREMRMFLQAFVLLALAGLCAPPAAAQVREREMERINWMEFKETVPSKVQTVLLPTGTLEPHGVVNNGADITAPLTMARKVAPRVNAMIAPALPYGITGSMEAYPGAFQITESAYRPFVKQILEGLA